MTDIIDEEKRTAPTLTYSQARNRADEVHARMEQIGELDNPTDEENAEFRDLGVEFDSLVEHMGRLERAAELARVAKSAERIGKPATLKIDRSGVGTERGSDYDRDAILEPDSVEDCRFRNPWDLREVRTFGRGSAEVAGELRARALSAIEKMAGADDKVRQAATTIIENFDDKNGSLARQALVTSSPAYLRAWSKMARNQSHSLTDDESRALDEMRAMSLTDANGGYLVPFQLDPTVIITSAGSRNDIRQFARQVVATGDKWHGVASGAVAWSWDAEADQVSDDSTTFTQPTVDLYKAAGFVPISIEALEDEANVTAEVARLLAFGKDQLEAAAFITGNGTTQPTGLITALDGTSAEHAPATAETFALADVYSVQGALPARHRANASWLANNLIYNRIRQFDSSGGAGLWERVGNDRPAQLLGRPVGEAEAMDGVINAAATEDNFVLAFGNFDNYVIADRVGMSIEFIPHLFGGNQRPTGQRGWYAYYRGGANVVDPGAFKVLNVATSA